VSDVVNLNKFRKRKKTAKKQAQAAENRVKFGRTKAEKARDKKEREILGNQLDGSRRDDRA